MSEALKIARQRAYKRGYNVAKRKAYEWLKTIDPDYYIGTKVNGELYLDVKLLKKDFNKTMELWTDKT